MIRHRFIGDTLLMLPMLAALRQALPDAHITVMTAPDSAPLLTHCPFVDESWVFGVKASPEGTGIPGFWAVVKRARQQRFTAALVLKRSFSSAALPFLAGIPVRVGFTTEGRDLLLTHGVPYMAQQHEANCFYQVLQTYLQHLQSNGVATQPYSTTNLPAVWFAPGEPAAILARWQRAVNGDRHIGFHVGASNSGKQWPLQRFIEVAQGWLSQNSRHTLHIFGGPGDLPAAKAVFNALPVSHQANTILWAGKLGLRETAGMLKQLHYLVTSDSGLSHLAAAVGTPVRVVFGPTNPVKWHPLDSETTTHQVMVTQSPPACMPCNLKVVCHLDHVCLSDVSAQTILASLNG